MRPSFRTALLACALTSLATGLASSASAAETSTDLGGRVHLAFRTGYGLPYGKYADTRTIATVRFDDVNAISNDTYGVVPLWLDAGYWLSDSFLIGGYFIFGLVFPKTAPAENPLAGGCPENFECSAIGVRAGIQAQYALITDGRVRPWIGLGAGFEWVRTHIEGRAGIPLELEVRNFGPELIHVQGGADFILDDSFALGPFASVSALRYTSCDSKVTGSDEPCEIDEGAWHGWIAFGVRGAFDL